MTGLLLRVRELCNEGLYLRAYEVARPLGPLDRWVSARARLVGGRLAFHLGAPDLARKLTLSAYRRDPCEPAARAAFAGVLLELRGPLEMWERTAAMGLAGLPPAATAELAGFRAHAAILLRDFEVAAAVLDEAEQRAPGDARLTLRRSMLLEAQDRYEDALDLALREVELRPGSQACVRWAAHLLVLVGRRDEALALLTAAAASMQSAAVLASLAALQADAGLHDERAASLQRFAELSPLLEAQPRAALEAELADLAYRRGNLDAAIAHARRSRVPSALRIAERLAAGGPARRVSLDVPFVRQHRLTCVPATLAALARYWKLPAEHLAVAEAICHDGTPAHGERCWAQDNGWASVELTVTWDAAVALLDRGVPIALHTHAALSGHCQAIIGYDARRGTLVVRDPYVARDLEVIADELLLRHRATGPRGLALVPAERAELLEGLDLPDAARHERLHALHCALDAHDRDGAGNEAAALAAQSPDHVVTLAARRALAASDGDFEELLLVAQRSLELHPGNPRARLDLLAALREVGSREQCVAVLEAICAEPGCDPIFFARLAIELADDPSQLARAERMARRAVREPRPTGESLASLASVLWQAGRHDEALRAFRFAACTEDRNERFARMFFTASLACGPDLAEGALAWLEGRRRRFGRRAGAAAATLAWALSQLDRTERAFEVLDEAWRACPHDSELGPAAADLHASLGHRAALVAWRAGRREDAIARVDRLTEQHPDNEHFWSMGFDWHRMVFGPERALGWLRGASASRPDDVRLRRVLAEALAGCGRPELALATLDEVLASAPEEVAAHDLRARVLAQLGRPQDARAAYAPPIFGERPPPELRLRRAAFEADQGQAERALRSVEEVLRDEPDNAEGLALLVRCLRDRCAPERALAAAESLARVAPDSASAHRTLAETRLAMGDRDGAVDALQRTLELAPDDILGAVALFEIHLESGEDAAAARALALLTRPAPNTACLLAIRLAIFRDDAASALSHMERLCLSKAAVASQLWGARGALIFAGLGEQTQELLAALARDGRAHDEVGRIVLCTRAARAAGPER